MRIIRIFILRLLIDPHEPGALRGSLQPVPEGEAQPFTDEETLLVALHRMTLPVADMDCMEPPMER